MLGFLKKFVSRSDSATATVPPPAPPARPVMPARPAARPAPMPRPAAPPSLPAAAAPSSVGTPRPAATPFRGSTSSAKISRPVVHSPDTDFVRPVQSAPVTGFVDVPFRKLFTKLAPAIQSAPHNLPETDDALFQIPLSIICEQLPKGALKISFSELRRFSPSGVFPANGFDDEAEVSIPLGEIVPCIRPGQLPRREGQRQVEVPQDIAPLFGPDGKPVKGLKVSDDKKSPGAAKTQGAAHSSPAAAQPTSHPKPPNQSAAPAPASIPAPAFAASPFSSSIPAATPATVSPILPIASVAPIAPVATALEAALSNEPIRAPKLDPALASLKPKATPSAAPQPKAAPATPTVSTAKASPTESKGNFHLPLMDLSAHWTAAGKEELAGLYRHSVEIPMERVEAGLRRGKLVFSWREIKPWLRLAAGQGVPNIADDYEVDLPLHIIAPRYLQEKSPAKAGKRVLPGDDIPDVFDIKPADIAAARQEAAPAAEMTPAPQPVIVAPSAAAEVTLESPAPNRLFEYGEIFGQPDKKTWTLGEVAQKCSTLRGVDGALIGDADGLLIAGNWNGDVPPESVAAFLPQMFRRIQEYSIELQLGDSNNFILMVENVPLQIFKAGSNYLAVLGKTGENLPKAQLTAIAKRLAQTGK